MWKILSLSLLVLVVYSSPLYSLSPEEEAALPQMSKEELIEIILIYDRTLNQIEIEQIEKDRILNERKLLIEKRENRATEQEASFVMREQLLVESLKIRKEMERANFWKGFGFGGLSGLALGGISGGFIGAQFK